MTNLLRGTAAPAQFKAGPSTPSRFHSAGRRIAQFAAVFVVLMIYSYPALRAKADFGTASLPPEFAPDLSLYLNVSSVRTVSPGQVLNPYYLVPVPANGTAYLKARMGPILFSGWNQLLAGRIWLAMFLWNLFWWGLLGAAALWLFERFLPVDLPEVGVTGLFLLMLVNIGMARTVLAAWAHLPSLSGFESISLQLPFMRAFTPQIPMPLLLGYLGLQMGALRTKGFYRWVGMGVLQLLALAVFPYATLMMAGITFVSVLWTMFSRGFRSSWQTPLVYGAACAIVDAVFLMRGSLNIYASHTSPIHFQPQVLPHLVGGVWFLLCLLTAATILNKTLPSEVKWPLAGLGMTLVVLLLGDAIVPSTVLLLSVHAGYFAHITAAVMVTFLASSALARWGRPSSKIRIAVGLVLGLLVLNGSFLAVGGYRAFLPINRQQSEVARVLNSWQPAEGDLFIASSRSADDACGWAPLVARAPVLFCTDAEVMLTPQQNREIHRFRQALYLYFTGKDSRYLQHLIADPNPARALYQMGFWAEALTWSAEERAEGLRSIQSDLIPPMEQVEKHDAATTQFFHQFHRIVLVDDLRDPTFLPERVGSFLKLTGEQHLDHWVLRSYVPR